MGNKKASDNTANKISTALADQNRKGLDLLVEKIHTCGRSHLGQCFCVSSVIAGLLKLDFLRLSGEQHKGKNHDFLQSHVSSKVNALSCRFHRSFILTSKYSIRGNEHNEDNEDSEDNGDNRTIGQ